MVQEYRLKLHPAVLALSQHPDFRRHLDFQTAVGLLDILRKAWMNDTPPNSFSDLQSTVIDQIWEKYNLELVIGFTTAHTAVAEIEYSAGRFTVDLYFYDAENENWSYLLQLSFQGKDLTPTVGAVGFHREPTARAILAVRDEEELDSRAGM